MIRVHLLKNVSKGFVIYLGLASSDDAKVGDELCNDLLKVFEIERPISLHIQQSEAKLVLLSFLSVDQSVHNGGELSEVNVLVVICVHHFEDPIGEKGIRV